ncbi:hypothetical protein RFI_03818, partial [Reticulomyxa filosa]
GHDSALEVCALSFDGKLLATASKKGTLLRIWDTATNEKIQEVRRGADQVNIQSLCFSPKTAKWLAVSSDKGTVHIFKVKKTSTSEEKSPKAHTSNTIPDKDEKEVENPTSNLTMFKSVLPKYFSSEWSFAQFRTANVKTLVAFGSADNVLIVVSADGMFYKASFDEEKGGECKLLEKVEFLKKKNSE